MHKFQTLYAFQRGDITKAEALQSLRTSERTLHQLSSIWAEALPKLVPLLTGLEKPQNTKNDQVKLKRQIGQALNITYRQVNRLIKSAEIDVPEPKSKGNRRKARESAREKRKLREKWAIDVLFGLTTPSEAAIQAEVSERQMYRLCAKASALAGMAYRDLAQLDPEARHAVATQIERKLTHGRI